MIDTFRFPNPFPPPFASAWGDDKFGLWADFSLPASEYSDTVSQRLRWIEAGSFLMGSPDDEPERLDNEGPQHKVTISQGFWLADTACTQALWLAVMGGENPSYFHDDLNQPVERVSWHDVQTFLQRLQRMLLGCQADLPSEAEWEYACRAGTDTPFSFGSNITPQKVNYHGDYPYAEDKKGESLKKILPVKSLPANPWGLYEMHGNIWEWCKDGQRLYDEHSQIDPVGALTGDNFQRVVRGGSWSSNARWARSAYRDMALPIDSGYISFRICLRSILPSQDTDFSDRIAEPS
jgi:sulfatase modifying factor 1